MKNQKESGRPWRPVPAAGLSPEKRAVIDRSIANAHQVGRYFPLTKPPRLGERGFGYVELAVIAVVVIALAAGARWMFVLGSNAKQAEWDRDKVRAMNVALARDKDVSDAINEREAQRSMAQHRAEKRDSEVQEAIREARRTRTLLAGCQEQGPDTAPPGAAVSVAGQPPAQGLRAPALRDPGGGVRFTWEFVREFDGRWTGLDGESVSGLALGNDGAFRAGAFAPYGPEDVSAIAQENAVRCSRDRREFQALIRKVEAAGFAWDKGRTK